MSEFLSNNQEANSDPTGWENMDAKDKVLEPIIDVENSRVEVEATPEEYEKFVKDNFNKLLNNLSDPSINVDTASEQEINAQFAITANLLDAIDHSVSGQIQTEDIFGAIETKYHSLYNLHSSRGQNHNADTDQRLMEATTVVKNQFVDYVTDHRPKGPDDLSGDAIS